MLSAADNALLTRTGPDAPMGALFRRFWVPALLSRELPERDGPPVRVTLMGEKLVAFRDSDGRVCLTDGVCPHRGANLFWGRNEARGLRCIYHGWKFDVGGACVDMPNVADPAMRAALQAEAKLKTYPVREAGDIVWAYLGPRAPLPELPALEWLTVAARQRFVSKKLQQCNYAQALEGAIDTAHFSFLHATLATDPEDIKRDMARADTSANDDADARLRWIREDGAPRYEVIRRDVGLVLGGARKADGDALYWRISQFLLPNHAYAPQTAPGGNYLGQTWVPIDDTSCWIYTYSWNPERPLSDDEIARYKSGQSIHAEVDADFVPLRNRDNDYLIDRAVQKTRSFTGIEGVSEQDACAQDSQGLIADRTREHLTPTDLGVVQWRRLMLELARALTRGEEPVAPQHVASYAVRAGSIVAPASQTLVEVMRARFGDDEGRVRKVSAA